MSATNQLLAARYQFLQVLGSGDFGKTLLMADVHSPGHPQCVVKQLNLPTRNPTTLKFILGLLKKKVEVLEAIGRHAQIPSTMAAFEANHSFYIVQEFVAGRSLEAEILPGNPWPEGAVLALMREVLTVLAFVQEHGVIHGELKPSNLMRRKRDRSLVLLDFGLVKDVSRQVISRDVPVAKPPKRVSRVYVPREQREGNARFCSDHYALGMIAIQALTGLPAEELPDAEHPDIYHEIVATLQGTANLSVPTASLLARMVHPNADRRYQRAIDILNDLSLMTTPSAALKMPSEESVLTEEPLPSPDPEPLHKPVGLIAGLAGLAALALLTAVWSLRLPQRLMATQQIAAAQTAQQAGDVQGAIARYTNALQWDDRNLTALRQRSQLHFQNNQVNAAIADLTAALEINVAAPGVYYDRANLRFAIGDIQGAIDDYTQALDQDPNFIKAYINRGSARADWGDDRGAVDDYTQALDRNPPTEEQAAAYLNRCLSHSNLGEQVRALEDCSAAISLRPSHSLAYQNRGLVRRRLGDLQGALQDYQIAIQIEPNSPEPYYNRGLTRQSLDDFPGALADFSKAIALFPDHIFARYDRGLLYAQLGQPQAAIADFQHAAQLCLDVGRMGCYKDAQYQISQLSGSDE